MRPERAAIVIALACASIRSVQAQIPDDDPRCWRDPESGIVCRHAPAPGLRPSHPLNVSATTVSGGTTGFEAGLHYSAARPGTDHLVLAEISMGRHSRESNERYVELADLTTVIAVGKPYRTIVGFRHEATYHVSHVFSGVAGLRFGRAQQHASVTAHVGSIYNRDSGNSGLETSGVIQLFRNVPRFMSIDATLRGGYAWGAGGELAAARLGISRSLGQQIRIRGEWTADYLSGTATDASVGSSSWRVSAVIAPLGLLR